MENPLAHLPESFWDAADPCLLFHPDHPPKDLPSLRDWLAEHPKLQRHVLFRTSGSEGQAKFVALSKDALLIAAQAANAHLQASQSDRWLKALPAFHVGGFGILARAYLGNNEVITMTERWEPRKFLNRLVNDRITLTSLVPTQLYDLAQLEQRAPDLLKAVLLGGAALPSDLESRARALGWPLLKTYGFTEAGSQVATQPIEADVKAPLAVLPHWRVKTDADSCLQIAGPALFSGYLLVEEDEFRFDTSPIQEGWFTTTDRVELTPLADGSSHLTFIERQSQRLKIKGELVSLTEVREALTKAAEIMEIDPRWLTIVAVAHPRDGQSLVLVAEAALSLDKVERVREIYEVSVPGHWRFSAHAIVPSIPRSALGKLLEKPLSELVSDHSIT